MIGSIIGVSRLLLDTAKMIFPENGEVAAASNVADKAGNTYNLLTKHSVVQSGNRTLVAPIVGVDKTIVHASYMQAVMQVVMARDMHAVLAHISIKNAERMGIKIDEIIGGVQPRRAGLVSLAGCEAMNGNGPAPGKFNKGGNDGSEGTEVGNSSDTVTIGGKSYSDITEYTPLAIGRVVVATAHGPNGGKVELPLTFREIPMPMNPAQLLNVFQAAKSEDGFFARLNMWQAGEITGPQFFSGSDVNKEKFNIKNKDTTGYFEEMAKRERINKAQAIRTGVVSMNTMANTFIMSSDTAKQIELTIGKRFSNGRNLDAIFRAVDASRIVICDERNGVFEFLTNGDSLVETFTLKELETKAKKADGADSLEALARILAGK